jgi:transcriptional regulator GlxA family with amidase domain
MISVVILLFPEVDLLDVGGPYEVFLTADRIAQRGGADSQFSVVTVSPDGKPVSSYGGMGLVPSGSVESIAHADLIVIPGAIAIETVCATPEVRAAVATLIERSTIASSVCTGAFLLSDQQLLNDVPWTTHFEDVADLAARNGTDGGQAHVGWVDTGNVVTAGGLSNGLSMALHMVDRLHSRELAVATAAQIEYVWDPEAGITHTAD